MKFIVKLGYRVHYETEIEIEAETALIAMDVANTAKNNNTLPEFVGTFSTKPAILSANAKPLDKPLAP